MTNPKNTNRLIRETSPYLLQHAHNPVAWFPWGTEAFEKAVAEDKPVFLSVGYAACHWCHVMAHECFEDPEIAQIMNAHFVNVKVDREERPDVDEIYMNAVQVMTGSGGWPMSVFLTPQGVPFYGGTYFPPRTRHDIPGFPHVLESVAKHYREQGDNVADVAHRLHAHLRQMTRIDALTDALGEADFEMAFQKIRANFDFQNGGFGTQPKFPNAMNLEVCLRTHLRTGNAEALEMVTLTLEKMARGGIYDQLGGGFHRYSVDYRWLVPHFEKMLYDNALLARLYTQTYLVTKRPLFARIARATCDYVLREMTAPEGGFYSTQDADSEGEEGKFFVWEPQEVIALLGEEDGAAFCRYFDITARGNFEEKNIPNIPIAQAVDEDAIARWCAVLFEAREQRVKPARDEKIQASWNGLMISAFSQAYRAFGEPAYLTCAANAARFILAHMRTDEGLLLHTYCDGRARFNAYLDDYACLILGLIDLYEAGFEPSHLGAARDLMTVMIDQFWDDADGGFFYTGKDHETLIVRSKNPFDNATPSGNSTGVFALMRLSALLEREDWGEMAERVLHLFGRHIREMPSGFGNMVCALDLFLQRPVEVAVLGARDRADTAALLDVVDQTWRPHVVLCGGDEFASDAIPLLQNRGLVNGRATAYVCRNFVCSEPVTDAKALRKLLDEGADF